jgi:hypothetical protein
MYSYFLIATSAISEIGILEYVFRVLIVFASEDRKKSFPLQ